MTDAWRCTAAACQWTGDFCTDALAHERAEHVGNRTCKPVLYAGTFGDGATALRLTDANGTLYLAELAGVGRWPALAAPRGEVVSRCVATNAAEARCLYSADHGLTYHLYSDDRDAHAYRYGSLAASVEAFLAGQITKDTLARYYADVEALR